MMLMHKGKAHVKVDNKTHKISSGHAETSLMRQASKKYDSDILSTCTLFTSTEPCAMCAGAIYSGGVQKVIFGCSMERYIKIAGNSLDIHCLDVLASTNIDIIGPILEEEAVKVHKDYW